jgi:hypothetical protein
MLKIEAIEKHVLVFDLADVDLDGDYVLHLWFESWFHH